MNEKREHLLDRAFEGIFRNLGRYRYTSKVGIRSWIDSSQKEVEKKLITLLKFTYYWKRVTGVVC
jgi:hypothetical protein